MEERHEIISFSSDIPTKIFIQKLGNVSKHWHNSLEILFVLSGTVNITVDDKAITLTPDDVILINSNSLHELYSDSCELAAFQIKLSNMVYFKEYVDNYYNCCSVDNTHNEKYDFLRFLLARLIKENADIENKLTTLSLTAQLINELNAHFLGQRSASAVTSQKHLLRLRHIIDYISNHFREGITLNQLAEEENLSTAYLSRFFAQYFGMNYTAYYNDIRLDHAVNELLTSDDTITTIALNNGFTDPRSFVTLFKEKYKELPSQYRKSKHIMASQSTSHGDVNYFSISTFSSLSNLAEYLDYTKKSHNPKALLNAADTKEVIASYHDEIKTLSHTYHHVCCVGSAKEILLAPIQSMLRQQQKEVGYDFIKFHGILSDDMLLYDIRKNGTISISFVLLDQMMDFLLSIDLRPWMQLSFMPKQLASDLSKNAFYTEYNVSPPRDIHLWNSLVRDVVLHCMKRYGITEVLKWPFCVWNEPDTSVSMFGFEDENEFFEFYQNTYETVKAIHPDFIFGTPSLILASDNALAWDYRFFAFTKEHNCVPDFLNIHSYDDSVDTLTLNIGVGLEKANLLNIDMDRFYQHLNFVLTLSKKYYNKDLPVYMTEWNLTVNHRNFINDTCFKSCYIAKNLLENYDRINAFGYWSLTDLICENQLSNTVFHGGLGLFTQTGIPKPPYYVFKYLSRLGNHLISQGKGWFMTKASHSIQIALYNYEHYSKLYASGELFDMTATNRYTPFTLSKLLKFSFELKDIPVNRVSIRRYIVNREHGSAFDSWVLMGAPDFMSVEDTAILKNSSQPGFFLETKDIIDGKLQLTVTLDPLEFSFLEVQFL